MDILKILQIIIIFFSLSLHEYAHAYVSYSLGDPTPKLQGRLTPNPLKHLDPLGTIMIIFTVIAGRGIGRGKPVQVNPMYYKNPIKGEFLTALAGPTMNILLAIIGLFIVFIYMRIVGLPINSINMNSGDIIIFFWTSFSILNIMLAAFNMLPIYPLDGYRVIKIIKPSIGFWMEKNGLLITIIFLFLLLSTSLFGNIILNIVQFIFGILVTIFGNIFY